MQNLKDVITIPSAKNKMLHSCFLPAPREEAARCYGRESQLSWELSARWAAMLVDGLTPVCV